MVHHYFRGKTFFNKKYWKFSLQLSIPLIGYALAAQVLSVSDRMMISKWWIIVQLEFIVLCIPLVRYLYWYGVR